MFKVGDRVRNVTDGDSYFTKGGVYEVLRDGEGGVFCLRDNEGDFRTRREHHYHLLFGVRPPCLDMTVNDLIPLIVQWGGDRGIVANSTPLGQSRKTIEEVHELVTACAQLVMADEQCDEDGSLHAKDIRRTVVDDLEDAIGDVFVTLVMVAACAKLDIHRCVAAAYDEIKNRKGTLNSNGVWVKEGPND
jgi:hypothetical protein